MKINTVFGVEEVAGKVCLYCKEEKPLSEFPKHSLYKDNLDTRCRECIKRVSKVTRDILKLAPPKPEFCECCGEIPRKWVVDHCHDTNEFRGWICDRCNTGIGKLGDNVEGVMKAIKYLERFENA